MNSLLNPWATRCGQQPLTVPRSVQLCLSYPHLVHKACPNPWHAALRRHWTGKACHVAHPSSSGSHRHQVILHAAGFSATAVADGLPIRECIDEVLQGLDRSSCLVLQAPPGAGKTTVVPLALLLHSPPWLQSKRILVLEPRRVAAKAAARRMAATLGERVGQTVGYRVRLDSKVSSKTRIEVVTDGILLRRLQQDPSLEGVGAVLFDEFHERGLESDLSLALCLDVQECVRPDLRLAVMSATLGGGLAEDVQALLASHQQPVQGHGEQAASVPLVVSEGRSYPVATRYLGAPLERDRRALERAAAAAVEQALQTEAGDVLVFLPGVGEIRGVQQLLADSPAARGVKVLPLHGNLGPAPQDDAIRPDPSGRRRVVLATPIAESSITIDGVRVVVDSGYCRAPRYNPSTGVSRLEKVFISQASADQRRGRAGRTGPGVCYRLWDADKQLDEATPPEIYDADLAPLVLELALWGSPDGAGLAWLDPPERDAVAAATQLLQQLGALDAKARVTEQGRRMAQLGAHPRFAHMALTGERLRCPELACVLASLMGERDLLRAAGAQPSADIGLRLDALSGRGSAMSADPAAAFRVLEGARQMQRQLQRGVQVTVAIASNTSDTVDDSTMLDEAETEDEADSVAECQIADRITSSNHASSSNNSGSGQAFAEAWTAQARKGELVGALVATAYPDRIGKAKPGSKGSYLLSTGRTVKLLQETDSLRTCELLSVATLSGGRAGGNDIIQLAAAFSKTAIDRYLQDEVQEWDVAFWAPASKAVLGRRQQRLGSLVLSEEPIKLTDDVALPVLIQALQDSGYMSLPVPAKAEAWRARAEWLHQADVAATGSSELPDMSQLAIMSRLPQLLGPVLAGCRGKGDLQKLDWQSLLQGQLGYKDRQRLEEQAPAMLVLPTGTKAAIDYSRAQPTVRAKLQELFGLADTPRLGPPAGGGVPVVMELLSPAGRPLAVTSDIASFWASSYAAVKKEMAGRYPKHPWPADPASAPATRFTKKRLEAEQQAAAAAGGAPNQQKQAGAMQAAKKKRR